MLGRGRNAAFILFLAAFVLVYFSAFANASGGTQCINTCSTGAQDSGGCASSVNIGQQQDTCFVSESLTTSPQQTSGTGLSGPSSGATQQVSPAYDINKDNSQSVPWLLSCPLSPQYSQNPQNANALFYSYPYTSQNKNIAGDVCTSGAQPLLTTLSLPTKISWDTTHYATASVQPMSIMGAASLRAQNLAYSPMLQDGSLYTIPSAFATNSYVFERPRATAQNDIWTWSATFVDFGSAVPDQQQVTATPIHTYTNSESCGDGDEPACPTCTAPPGGTCTPPAPPPYPETYSCQYTYTETTNLQSIANTQIPFNDVQINDPSSKNPITFTQFNTAVLPYLTLNYIIPSPDGQSMYQSYDTFGPWNYNTPANSIDMLPIDTPSNLYFNYQGSLFYLPTSSLQSLDTLSKQLAHLATLVQNLPGLKLGIQKRLQNFGLLSPHFANPISITAIPNDYVFVLNSTASGCGTGTEGSDYCLTILRLIPRGYYNTTGNEPGGVQSVTVSGTLQQQGGGHGKVDCTKQQSGIDQWNCNWINYWNDVVDTQNDTTYVLQTVSLNPYISAYVASATSSPGCTSNACKLISGFVPLNISTDTGGDVYIAGKATSSYSGGKYAAIIEIPASGGGFAAPSQIKSTTGDWSTTSGAPVLPEMAASDIGSWVYAASPNSGTLYIFDGHTLAPAPKSTIDLTYSVANSQGSLLASLNILYYLSQGGLYSVRFDGSVAGAPNVYTDSTNNLDKSTDFDTNAFHHPIGIADINGYIYILDDWKGVVGESDSCFLGFLKAIGLDQCQKGGTTFDMLVLRMVDPVGNSVPINPTLFNDMFSRQSCSLAPPTNPSTCYTGSQLPLSPTPSCSQSSNPNVQCLVEITTCEDSNGNGGAQYSCVAQGGSGSSYYSLATASYAAGQQFPPYGWVLSANVVASTGGMVNICSSPKCTYNPGNIKSVYSGGFTPIGPGLTGTGQITGSGLSISFNNTIAILLKTSTNYQICLFGGCIQAGGCFLGFCAGSSNTDPHYNELLNTTFGPENYTKYFDANIGYACYTDSQDDGVNPGQAGCINTLAGQQGQQTDVLAGMQPPLYDVANPFRYLETLGAPLVVTLAGQGTGIVAAGSGTSGGGSSSGGISMKGPPSLTIGQGTVDWGTQDQISATAGTATDIVEIVIDGTTVATAQGQVSYFVCSSLSNCLTPGTHSVQVEEEATEEASESTEAAGSTITGPATLTVNPTPALNMQSVVLQGNGDLITATAPFPNDQVEILIDGKVVAGPTLRSVQYTASNLAVGTHTVEAEDITQQPSTTNTQQLSVIAQPSLTGAPVPTVPAQTLTSYISGYLVVPYAYTYTLTQHYAAGPSAPISGSGNDADDVCSLQLPSDPQTQTYTVYTDALTNGKSNNLQATIEGGPGYLFDVANNDHYIANLTDKNLVLPPQIQYYLQNDRLIGSLWVNATYCAGQSTGTPDCSPNNQAVLGATVQAQYNKQTYVQTSPTGQQLGGYETFAPQYINPPQYGGALAPIGAKGSVAQPSTAIDSSQPALGFNFNNVQLATILSLFDFYKESTYNSPLSLLINTLGYFATGGMYQTFGYQQLVYVMTDRFGNMLYAPVEADIANPVTIKLNVNAQVDQNNANLTRILISGQAYTPSSLGTLLTPLPRGQQIYLYYNKDLNFVNINPQDTKDAITCAYNLNNAPQGLDCTQSNPVFSNPAYAGTDTYRYTNSQQITYAPSYNYQGTCNQPTRGLLVPQYFKCNIYGNQYGAALSALCPSAGALSSCDSRFPDVASCLVNAYSKQSAGSGTLLDPQSYCSSTLSDYQQYLDCASKYQGGSAQWCKPTDYTTGNGICTSQLGLIGIATVSDNNGDFSLGTASNPIFACGASQDSITAQYYGYPAPEPVIVNQVPLQYAANSVNGNCGSASAPACKSSPQTEYNYQYSPSQPATVFFQTGLFELSYGNIGVLGLVLTLSVAVLYLVMARK